MVQGPIGLLSSALKPQFAFMIVTIFLFTVKQMSAKSGFQSIL